MSKLILTSPCVLMPWHILVAPSDELSVAEKPVASGGYGILYELETPVDHSLQLETKWLVKLCLADNPINAKGYERVCRLSEMIREWQLQLGYDVDDLMLYYGSLIGFPQATFTCTFDEGEYYGYLMPDLSSMGFLPFSEYADELAEDYINGLFEPGIWQARLKGVHSLAKTLGLLHDAFGFFHGDLKAESIWYHPSSHKFALIDYDGGSFKKTLLGKLLANLTEPQIKGTIQAWLAPEIMKASDEESGQARLKVTSYSDFWAFACCVFQLLSGINAFAFLNPDVYATRRRYHKFNVWPSLKAIDELLLFEPDERLELEGYLTICQSRPNIWQLFTKTFNQGFSNPTRRLNYETWEKALVAEVINKTSFLQIEVNPKVVLENGEVTFTWECNDGHLIINGINHKKHGTFTLNIHDYPSLKVVNAFGEWPVSVPLEIIKKPRVRSVSSCVPFVKKCDAVVLQWDVDFAEKIIVSANGMDTIVSSPPFSFVPNDSQEVSLRFYSKNNLHVETRSLSIEVVKPVEIRFFKVDRVFIAETLPVTFSWQVENADGLTISGFERKLEATGEVTLRPKASGEYTLIASNKCFKTEQSLYIEVLPVPKIDHLRLPQLPEINVQLPDLTGNVPEFMRRLSEPQSIFKKIFDEQDN